MLTLKTAFLALLAAVTVTFTTVHTADAQNRRVNLLVVTEDADEDTVPRNNRVYQRVMLQLQESMNNRGFQIFDEVAIGMNVTNPNRVRRSRPELIEVARAYSMRTPLDAIVIFRIYASARQGQFSDLLTPEVRITGEILNIATGQFVAGFEVGGFQFPPLPGGCGRDRECLLERVGAEARLVANDLAAALADKLEGFRRRADGGGEVIRVDNSPATPRAQGECAGLPGAFVFQFRDFTASEMTQIEEAFVRFGCYEHHRTIRAMATSAEYWYETRSDAARINTNLRVMLEFLNFNAQVVMAGNRFEITRVRTN